MYASHNKPYVMLQQLSNIIVLTAGSTLCGACPGGQYSYSSGAHFYVLSDPHPYALACLHLKLVRAVENEWREGGRERMNG